MTQNWGVQMTFMIPLNSRSVDLCKDLAKNRLEKQRLDYELVRINNCTKIQQRGFTLRPGSRFEAICNDVIPIAALPNIEKEDPLSELANYYLEQIK